MRFWGLFIALILFAGFIQKKEGSLELERLTLKSPDGKSSIVLGFEKGEPLFQMVKGKNDMVTISFKEEKAHLSFAREGNVQISMESGKEPHFTFFQKQKPALKLFSSEEGSQLFLTNKADLPSLFLQGGESPGVFLKNQNQETVGSWSLLSDGGSALGLGMQGGKASAIFKGGDHPSAAFFSQLGEPMAALGMIRGVPHLLVSGQKEQEGILIHGGKPSSMLVVDELGKVKILISKHGVFQGKKESSPSSKKKEERIFSFQDLKKLSIENP